MSKCKLTPEIADIIIDMVNSGCAKQDIAKAINVQLATLNTYLVRLNIDYHGQQGICENKTTGYIPFDVYIKLPHPNAGAIKQKLLKENIKQFKCELCGLMEWNGSRDNLVIELHHIDGNHNNNSIDNLMLLCPNCHRMLTRKQWKDKGLRKDSTDNISISKYQCKICGKNISGVTFTRTGLCRSCYDKNRSAERLLSDISYNHMKCLLISSKSITEISKLFNVSDNLIRIRCKELGLPYKKKDIIKLKNSSECG